MDRIEEKIISIIDAHADELEALAQDIYAHAEQGYHEYRTAKIVSDFLKKLGLETKEGLAITGVKAAIGTGEGPNVALIGELDGLSCPSHPAATPEGYASSWAQYTLRAKDHAERERLTAALKEAGVPTMVYYPKPLHRQEVYRSLAHQAESLPVSESLCERVFSLPMHGYLTEETVSAICGELCRAQEA